MKDTIYIDADHAEVVCRLSSARFKKFTSKGIASTDEFTSVSATKNGFELQNNWMRAGNANQFRYNKTLKRIQLIGMSRYEFGNASNDGSGESSVNLLTGDYIGNWNYYDHLADNEQGELIKMPSIKTKMFFKITFLEDFDEATCENYSDRCSRLYEQAKVRSKKHRNDSKSD
ncbi:MAG: hypothetical protein EOO88_33340 [Pedobacter sp.]|nr:MAG: hypothetical protein EOO88_33340 [Pedobacter sp.]